MSIIDYAHTPKANARRREKAKAVARALWPPNTPDRPPTDVVRAYCRDTQKAWEKVAGVDTDHPEELWQAIVGLLEDMERYEALTAPIEDLIASALNAPPPPINLPPRKRIVVRHAGADTPPCGPVDLCLLPCLCVLPQRYTPGGKWCAQHYRYANPVPDPARSATALRLAASERHKP